MGRNLFCRLFVRAHTDHAEHHQLYGNGNSQQDQRGEQAAVCAKESLCNARDDVAHCRAGSRRNGVGQLGGHMVHMAAVGTGGCHDGGVRDGGAPVINEDPENGRNGAFWGVAKQRTLNILQTTMINYSIVMRSVNANLLEINQAKSRINQAKKEGTTPDPKDLELVKTEKQNAFAISQYTDIMTIEKFAKHITSHGSVYSRADISAILYIAVDCMREMLLEGKKIRLGDLGDFSLLLTSKGAEDADKFTAQNITGVKVQWEPGQEFKNLRDDAEFNLVASRSAQAAVIKAIKEGKTSVDLNAPTTPDNTPGASTPGGSNTGQTGSEGQGSESGGGTTGKDDTGDGLE